MNGTSTTPPIILGRDARIAGSVNDLASSVRRGERVRIRPGAYAPSSWWYEATDHERRRAAVIAYARRRPGTIVVGESAALLHGIPLIERLDSHVQVLSRRADGSRTRDDVRERRFRRRPTVVDRDGVLVASVLDTIMDLARTGSFRRAVVALDAHLHDRMLAGEDQEDARAELDAFRRIVGGPRGIRKAERAIAFADGRAESPLESVSRVVIAEAELEAPELQREWILGDGSVARTDFFFPRARVVGEADGLGKYSMGGPASKGDAEDEPTTGADGTAVASTMLASFAAEKRRDSALRDRGRNVVHWGWQEAWDGAPLVARLHRAGVRSAALPTFAPSSRGSRKSTREPL